MKKLIIAPHIDDEILGCGGILDETCVVLHCGVENRSYVSREERIEEITKAQKFLGFSMHLLDHTVNSYVASDLIGDFERFIGEQKPDMVFLPYPSYNQDHRAVFDAALVALRPHDQNFFVKKVLVYEQPHSFFWSHNGRDTFIPQYFVEIDVERKIKAYELLASQVRAFRSPEHLRSLAVLRGGQSNVAFAEAFQVVRWI